MRPANASTIGCSILSKPCSRNNAAERGFEQCGQDVAIAGEALELVRGDVDATSGELVSELELASNDRTALTRNDVRADLREASLR